jgi:hypothetical protein
MQQVFDIAQRQRELDVTHHIQDYSIMAHLELAEGLHFG